MRVILIEVEERGIYIKRYYLKKLTSRRVLTEKLLIIHENFVQKSRGNDEKNEWEIEQLLIVCVLLLCVYFISLNGESHWQ